MTTKFKKVKEDFVCERCKEGIKGTGFTNHCPKCLWSKHVDVFPGDRAEKCGGLMKPIDAEQEGKEWSITHKCQKCNAQKKNKISPKDNFDQVVKISRSVEIKLVRDGGIEPPTSVWKTDIIPFN